MNGLSDQVRVRAKAKYIQPGIAAGKRQFSISVKELLKELEAEGAPANRARQVCMALTSGKFLRENGLEIEAIDGPPSKTSTTVVVRYRVAIPGAHKETGKLPTESGQTAPGEETPEERAHRLTGKLFGLLKEELAEYGGGEAFIRWIRSENEDAA